MWNFWDNAKTVVCIVAIVFAFTAYLRSDKGTMGILRLQYEFQERVKAVEAKNDATSND